MSAPGGKQPSRRSFEQAAAEFPSLFSFSGCAAGLDGPKPASVVSGSEAERDSFMRQNRFDCLCAGTFGDAALSGHCFTGLRTELRFIPVRKDAASDSHGFFSPLREAPEKSGFLQDSDEHKRVVLGDLFDRGD